MLEGGVGFREKHDAEAGNKAVGGLGELGFGGVAEDEAGEHPATPEQPAAATAGGADAT